MPEHDVTSPDRGFAPGTRIFTLRGEVAVEALRHGDMLVTLSGRGAPLKPRIACTTAPGETVRVAADTIAPGIPVNELLLGAGQMLRLDGNLVPMLALVNGTTITRGPTLLLHRVTLAQPDILIAEGAPIASLPDPAPDSLDPGRLAAIRAALTARAAPARDPRDALLDDLIAGEEALSSGSSLQDGAAPSALGDGTKDG